MAKKKDKKARRELEKLQRTGRGWDWLKAVQDLPPTREIEKDREAVWKDLIRRAVRSFPAFEEFCTQVDSVTKPSSHADVEFFLALRKFLDDPDAENVFPSRKDLSPPVQDLYDKRFSLTDDLFPRSKTAALLKQFVKHPEKISRRHYEDLARLVAHPALAGPVAALAQNIAEFRKLNHKSVLKGSLRKVDHLDLGFDDGEVADAAERIPASLRSVLLLPFCTQICLFLKNCHERPGTEWLSGFFSDLPYLAPLVVGEEARTTLRDLALEHPDSLREENIPELKSAFASAPLETRLSLLSRVREVLHRQAEDPMNDFPLFLFPGARSTEQWGELVMGFYEEVFRELGEQRGRISKRDRRSLGHIMDPIICRDVDILFDQETAAGALSRFLILAADAGCMGRRLALLGTVLARLDETRRLGILSSATLDELPPPEERDLDWLLKKWPLLVCRSSRSMAAILKRLAPHEELTEHFVHNLWFQFSSQVALATFHGNRSMPFSRGGSLQRSAREAVILGVEEVKPLLGDFPQLHVVNEFLSLFADGRFQPDTLNRWLELTWADPHPARFFLSTCELIAANVTDDLLALSHALGLSSAARASAPDGGSPAEVLLQFIKDHCEDLRRMPHERLSGILEVLLVLLDETQHDGTLVTRLFNVVSARIDEGETDLVELRAELLRHMKEKMKSGKNVKKRR